MLIVQKYGGTSVANAASIKNVARIIAKTYNEGHKVVAVLSAQGNTTDKFIKKAAELCDNPPKRELDRLLSTGEQHSVALMAIRLFALGIPAISLGALQAGIHTTSNHGNAKIRYVNTERIQSELKNGMVVLVAGFQGVSAEGHITTLGRGGSDTTAVALAVALGADSCEIYKDVEGIYTTDPKTVKSAKKYKEVCYSDMLCMATRGARVLHNRAVELAMRYGVQMRVRSSITDNEGTIITGGGEEYEEYKAGEREMERRSVMGCAVDRDVFLVSVREAGGGTAGMYKLFHTLAKNGISVDTISQSCGAEYRDIQFTVSRADGARAVNVLDGSRNELCIEEITTDDTLAKISVMGAGVATDAGVAAKMFEAVSECGGEIFLVATSETNISVLIKSHECEKILEAVHCKFELGE